MENLKLNKTQTYAEKLAANKRRESNLLANNNILSQDLIMQVFEEDEQSESLTSSGQD